MTPEVQEALRLCPSLPTLSSVADSVVRLARDPDPDATSLVRLVTQDPALVSRLLRVSNSPLYARRRSADNLHEAISVLGINTTITVALSFSLADSIRTSEASFRLTQYVWRRSLLAAVTSRRIGAMLGVRQGEELFLAGLLQDIGMLALQVALPEHYAEIAHEPESDPEHDTIAAREKEAFGCDHSEASAWLMRDWQMPEYLAACAHGSHDPSRSTGEAWSHLVRCVALSSRVVEFYLSGQETRSAESLAADAHHLVGLSQERTYDLLAGIAEELPTIEQLFETEILSPAYAAGIVDQAREILTIRNLELLRQISEQQLHAQELETRTSELRETAHRDGLTGIHNRWHLDQRLETEYTLATEHNWPLVIGFLDLDHFKQVNDEHGHQVGDQTLAQTARVLERSLREGDCVARYGGEEFVVLLPGTDSRDAGIVMERLRRAVESEVHTTHEGVELRVTASIGVTIYVPGEHDVQGPSTLVREADRALYDAKGSGRNRIVFSDLLARKEKLAQRK